MQKKTAKDFKHLRGKYVIIKHGKKKHIAIYVKFFPEYNNHECISLTASKRGDRLAQSRFMVREKEFVVLESLDQLL